MKNILLLSFIIFSFPAYATCVEGNCIGDGTISMLQNDLHGRVIGVNSGQYQGGDCKPRLYKTLQGGEIVTKYGVTCKEGEKVEKHEVQVLKDDGTVFLALVDAKTGNIIEIKQ